MCIDQKDLAKASQIIYRPSKQMTLEEFNFLKGLNFPAEYLTFEIKENVLS